jgi:hypothetical protein
MEPKAESEKKHALRRVKERRGFALSGAEYDRLCDLLKAHAPYQCSRDVKFFYQESIRLIHWAVNYREEWMVMIYDAFRNRIVTVLKSNALAYHRYRPALKTLRLRVRRRQDKWSLVHDKPRLRPSETF